MGIEEEFEKACIKWHGRPEISVWEMCEAISKADEIAGGSETPMDIQNYSPTGELFMIPFWFMDAIDYLEQEGCYEYKISRRKKRQGFYNPIGYNRPGSYLRPSGNNWG